MNAIDIATALIQKWEGCVLTAYPDPASGGDPWTVGYGATGPDITQDTVWTQDQVNADLAERLTSLLARLASGCPSDASPNELGACLSLAYNIGDGAFAQSTLLRLWNDGDVQGAADQFLVWNKAAGKVMQGLVNRRDDEQRVFLGGDPS